MAVLPIAAVALLIPAARSGHEQSIYPSYYPHEIEIATVAPAPAAQRLHDGKLHAYAGDGLSGVALSGDAIGDVTSLGGFVVLKLNPASIAAADHDASCRALAAASRRLDAPAFIFHPYPVTPLHGDYLHHADRAAAAQKAINDAPEPPAPLRLRAGDADAARLAPAALRTAGDDWDVAVDIVRGHDLIAGATSTLNGWIGPRWVRTGWSHAYRLLADAADTATRQRLDSEFARLRSGEGDDDLAGRINTERDLVADLTKGCRAMVAGYIERREYFNSGFATGIENISFGALDGFNTPMFFRTVKLREFPWNGWLRLGLDGAPAAAWNPMAGFNDDFGRLMWSAVGDPAMLPAPYDTNWMLNRVSDVEETPRR